MDSPDFENFPDYRPGRDVRKSPTLLTSVTLDRSYESNLIFRVLSQLGALHLKRVTFIRCKKKDSSSGN